MKMLRLIYVDFCCFQERNEKVETLLFPDFSFVKNKFSVIFKNIFSISSKKNNYYINFKRSLF